MSDTKRPTDPSNRAAIPTVTPSLAEGRSRLVLFAGLCCLAVGHLFDTPVVVWVSILAIVFAFLLNTAGKLRHYRTLSIPRRHRRRLSASWLLLAVTVVGLLVNYAYTRYGPGDGAFFWSLALAGLGFGLLHLAAQSTYLDGVDAAE